MRKNRLLLSLVAAATLQAWNDAGHMAVAYIAYQTMSSTARAEVDRLLKAHVDYARWVEGVAEEQKGLVAFMRAATWPDAIRNDPRFQNDPPDNADALVPNSLGLPNLYRHTNWHYINRPLIGNYAKLKVDKSDQSYLKPPTVISKIHELRAAIADQKLTERVRAYYLSWLLHLVGDVHQPLHCVAHQDDQGGNRVLLNPGPVRLHGYWDGILGRNDSFDAVRALAEDLMKVPVKGKNKLDEMTWLSEGTNLAIAVVYKGLAKATATDGRLEVPAGYEDTARRAARPRAAVAGWRLGSLITARFKP